jgi:hypothetical protein
MNETIKKGKFFKDLNGNVVVSRDERAINRHRLRPQEKNILTNIYGMIWYQAYMNEGKYSIQEFAQLLAEEMAVLNKMLRFKE